MVELKLYVIVSARQVLKSVDEKAVKVDEQMLSWPVFEWESIEKYSWKFLILQQIITYYMLSELSVIV